MKSERVIASDGLIARSNGAYAKAKLEWMQAYLTRGLSVARSKLDRVYVDLFAGPGLNVDSTTGEEFESGALRALKLVGDDSEGAPFTQAFLVNLDHDEHEALTARVDRLSASGKLRIPRHRVHLIEGDANVEVDRVVAQVHQRAWMFVFADIEAPSQLPFATISTLKMSGHQSVDLYVLFPLQMGLQRLMSYKLEDRDKFGNVLDEYFGTPSWRTVRDDRVTDAQGDRFRRELEDVYCAQLQLLWSTAGCVTRINLEGNRTLYHMIFAVSNPAAIAVADGVTKRMEKERRRWQGDLFP